MLLKAVLKSKHTPIDEQFLQPLEEKIPTDSAFASPKQTHQSDDRIVDEVGIAGIKVADQIKRQRQQSPDRGIISNLCLFPPEDGFRESEDAFDFGAEEIKTIDAAGRLPRGHGQIGQQHHGLDKNRASMTIREADSHHRVGGALQAKWSPSQMTGDILICGVIEPNFADGVLRKLGTGNVYDRQGARMTIHKDPGHRARCFQPNHKHILSFFVNQGHIAVSIELSIQDMTACALWSLLLHMLGDSCELPLEHPIEIDITVVVKKLLNLGRTVGGERLRSRSVGGRALSFLILGSFLFGHIMRIPIAIHRNIQRLWRVTAFIQHHRIECLIAWN